MYILDTNTLIYYFKGMGNVADRLLEHPPRDIAIPSIVLYELEVGLAKSTKPEKRRRQLEMLAELVGILPLGVEEAKTAAIICANLEAAGIPIGPMDTLIAGTALANHGTLVTHNTKEFSRVDGLRITDWYM
ncbi:MAG: type II toxin-antitoxin system VapC family toxin [Mariprofundaceae bacterium]|nr:type II toxin-antitoxin system VapC family toxin [Mariprofundaceae bacterium]